MTQARIDAVIGIVIIAASIGAFFAYGFAFHLFDYKFKLRLVELGFVIWPVVGALGWGYIRNRLAGGLRDAAIVLVALTIALVLGITFGNYR